MPDLGFISTRIRVITCVHATCVGIFFGRARSRSHMSAPDDSSVLQTRVTSDPPLIPHGLISNGSTGVSTPGQDEKQGLRASGNGDAEVCLTGEAANAAGSARRVTLEQPLATPGYQAFQVKTGQAQRRACHSLSFSDFRNIGSRDTSRTATRAVAAAVRRILCIRQPDRTDQHFTQSVAAIQDGPARLRAA